MNFKYYLAIFLDIALYIPHIISDSIINRADSKRIYAKYQSFYNNIDVYTYCNSSVKKIATTIAVLNELDKKCLNNQIVAIPNASKLQNTITELKRYIRILKTIFAQETHTKDKYQKHRILTDFYFPHIDIIYKSDLNKVVSFLFDSRFKEIDIPNIHYCRVFLEFIGAITLNNYANYRLLEIELPVENTVDHADNCDCGYCGTVNIRIKEENFEVFRTLWYYQFQLFDQFLCFLRIHDINEKNNKVCNEILKFLQFSKDFATKDKENRCKEGCFLRMQIFIFNYPEAFNFLTLINRIIIYTKVNDKQNYPEKSIYYKEIHAIRNNIWGCIDDCLEGINSLCECVDSLFEASCFRKIFDDEALKALLVSYAQVMSGQEYYNILLHSLCKNEVLLLSAFERLNE